MVFVGVYVRIVLYICVSFKSTLDKEKFGKRKFLAKSSLLVEKTIENRQTFCLTWTVSNR